MAKKLIQIVYQVTDADLIKAEKSIKANEKAANDADKAVNKYGKDAKKAGEDASKSFLNLGNVWKGLIAIGIVAFFTNLAKKTFELGVQQEQLTIAFTTFLGSAEKAKKLLGELTKFAIITPFTPDQVNKAAKALLAFGVTGDQIIPTLKMLGDVSAGTGKDLTEMAIIFGQIRSTGRLMGQDLLQLINAGFNPLSVISDKTGKSVAQLKTEMEKGLITFDMVSDSFKTATSEGGLFFNLMEKQSQSIGGLLSTVSGNIDEVLKNVFAANSGPLKKFTDLLVELSEGILFFSKSTEQFADEAAAAMTQLHIENFEAFAKAFKDLQSAQAANSRGLEIEMTRLVARQKELETSTTALTEADIKEYDQTLERIRQIPLEKAAIDSLVKAKETADLKGQLEKESAAAAIAGKALAKLREEYHKYAEEVSKQVAKDPEITEGFGIDNLFGTQTRVDQNKLIEDDTKRMLKELDAATQRSADERVRIELEAANKQADLRRAAIDFGIDLIGQALMASVGAQEEETQSQEREFERRIELAGDNKEQVKQIRQEQEAFEEESRKRAGEQDKEVQLKQMIITSLLNALRALGTPPVPNFALAGLTAGAGAASIGIARGIGFKEGGWIEGPGTPTSDSIPIMASRNEFMVNARSAGRAPNLLEAINSGILDDRVLNKIMGAKSGPTERFDDSRVVAAVEKLASRSSYEEGHFTVNRVTISKNLTRHIKSKFRS